MLNNYRKTIYLAGKLPSGANDPNAINKMFAEMVECNKELPNSVAQIMARLDIIYYVCKAHYSNLIEYSALIALISDQSRLSKIHENVLFEMLFIKYGMRAEKGNPKNKKAEYSAILAYMEKNNV